MVLLAAVCASCGPAAARVATRVAEETPEPFIRETLDTLQDEEVRDLFVAVLATPEVREATRELVASVTDGTLDALTMEGRAARLDELTARYVGVVSRAIEEAFAERIGPSLEASAARTLDRGLERLLAEETMEGAGRATERLAERMTAAMMVAVRDELGPSVRSAVQDDLGPALGDALRQHLGPALRDSLTDPEMQAALGATTRIMAREATLGLQEAFQEIDAREHETPTVLTRVQHWAARETDLLQFILIAVLGGLVLLLLWLQRSAARARQREADARRQESTIDALRERLAPDDRRAKEHGSPPRAPPEPSRG